MTTKLIGLKDFRLNLADYTKQVESKKVRLIILKKNKPILEVNPVMIKEFTLEALRGEVAKARNQVEKGEVYTLEEARKNLKNEE